MILYVVRRAGLMLIQLVAVVSGIFVLLRLLPADPTTLYVIETATPEDIQALREKLGLSPPIHEQLRTYLTGLLHGDLGTSWVSGKPVTEELQDRLGVTFQMVFLALLLALVFALVVGLAAARRADGRFDRAVLSYTLFAPAQPAFFWCLVAIFVFFTKLGIAPAPIGLTSFDTVPPDPQTGIPLLDAVIQGNWAAFQDMLAHLAIPVLLLAVLIAAPLTKMTRQSVLTAAQSDYVLYGRMAGLRPRRLRSYMLRNGLPPVVTLTGIFFAGLLGGAVLIESIFAFPGLGLYALKSTSQLDYPAVQGCVLLLTLVALIMYLVMDVIYAILDPRVAYGKVPN